MDFELSGVQPQTDEAKGAAPTTPGPFDPPRVGIQAFPTRQPRAWPSIIWPWPRRVSSLAMNSSLALAG